MPYNRIQLNLLPLFGLIVGAFGGGPTGQGIIMYCDEDTHAMCIDPLKYKYIWIHIFGDPQCRKDRSAMDTFCIIFGVD